MAEPYLSQYHRTQYERAEEIFEDGDIDKAIEQAQHNLAEHTISPYYYMKNVILIACGQDDRWVADAYTRAAEKAYTETHKKATLRNDTGSLEGLEEIRDALDQLTQRNNEKMFAETGIRVYFASDDIDDLYYDNLEDDEVLSETEDFDELSESDGTDEMVAAEYVVLPIRTSGPAGSDVEAQGVTSSSATTTPAQTHTALSLAEPASNIRA